MPDSLIRPGARISYIRSTGARVMLSLRHDRNRGIWRWQDSGRPRWGSSDRLQPIAALDSWIHVHGLNLPGEELARLQRLAEANRHCSCSTERLTHVRARRLQSSAGARASAGRPRGRVRVPFRVPLRLGLASSGPAPSSMGRPAPLPPPSQPPSPPLTQLPMDVDSAHLLPCVTQVRSACLLPLLL
eukprot:1797039-Amphidinium_carterae.1